MQSGALRLLAAGIFVGFAVGGGASDVAAAPPELAPPVIMPSEPAQPIPARGPRTVWLDFEGSTLTASASSDSSTMDISFILSGAYAPGTMVTIPAFQASDLGDAQGMTRQQIIDYVKAQMEAIHAPYDIAFVLARPAQGPYERLIFGGTCSSISGGSQCAGIAVLNCGDSNLNNIGYAHPVNLDVEQLITTAAQELAHSFGLNHTEDTGDIMFPMLQQDGDPRSYGAGMIPATETGCGGAVFQDSHDLLLTNVGPFGQDVTVPLLSIDTPVSNGLDDDGDVTISVTATDDEELVSVGCGVDGTTLGTLTSPPFEFTATGLDVGSHTVECTATDDSSNTATATVTFFVGECVTSGDCSGDLVCDQNLCVEPTGDGIVGDECTEASDCASGLCRSIDAFTRCTESCTSNGDCPAGFDCLPDDNVCWEPDDDNGGNEGDGDGGPLGCLSPTVAPDTPSGGLTLLFALVALALLRRGRS